MLQIAHRRIGSGSATTVMLRRVRMEQGRRMNDSSEWNADVLVVVPAHNESGVIGPVVEDLAVQFPNVLVIDDGSADATGQVAAQAGAKVAYHLINLGQGGALITGFKVASALPRINWVVTFDADGQHRVEDAVAMLELARSDQLDVVLGTRFGEGTSDASAVKRFVLRLATVYTRWSTGLSVTDTHNGLRVLSRQVAEGIVIRDRGMGHASDILDFIAHTNLNWQEHPVHIAYTDYSTAKGQSMFNALNIIFDRWVR